MKEYVLTIDCGTQSLKVMLFDANANIIAERKEKFKPYFSLMPGWAEQDPTIYYDSACKAMNFIRGNYPNEWNEIAAIVITALRSTHVLLDKDGNVLRPSILWLDQRRSQTLPKLGFWDRIMFSLISMKKTVQTIGAQSKANWIKENEPDIWARTHKYMTVSGYFYYRLTGRFVDSIASQIGLLPFDYKSKVWHKSSKHWKFRVFGVESDKLYELAKPTEIVGTITEKAANETGLLQGLPVIAGGSDKGCETIANGCIDETCMSLSFGTTSTIQTTTSKYIEPIRFLPPYPAVLPNSYNPEIEIFRGYWMLNWFKTNFAYEEVEESKRSNVSAEEILNQKIKNIPPGSNGLILQPYWSPHIKTPQARGTILGFTDVHTKYHIYKAIIEGINYALIDGMEKIISKTGVKPNEIVVGGGGAQSNEILQITSDMFGIPVKRVHTHEVSSLGAAIVGFVGLKVYNDFESAIKSMVRYERVFYPRRGIHDFYKTTYNKIYKKIYSRLKPFYRFMYKNNY